MKFKAFIFLCVLLAGASASAQSTDDVRVTAKVLEEDSALPVIQAAVELLDGRDSTRLDGTVTDAEGRFVLRAPMGDYTLRFTCIGYTTLRRNIHLSPSRNGLDLGVVSLAPESVQLGASVVSAKAEPVRVVGDTVVFNSAAFRVAEDADLAALLGKIPGIQIDASDNVTLNGKPVKQLLVNGKKYFGGDVKTGLRNISADMIENIRAYDRESDFTRMTGIEDGEEEPVLDLTIKKDMMNGWHTNVRAGIGSSVGEGVPLPSALRYSGRANASKVSDKSQVNVVLDGYNTPSKVSTTNTSRIQLGSGANGERHVGQGGATFSVEKKNVEIGGHLRYNGIDRDSRLTGRSQSIQPNKLVIDKSVTPYDTTTVTPINFSNSNSNALNLTHEVKGDLTVEWRPDKYNTFYFKPDFTFAYTDAFSHSNAMTFNDDPYAVVGNPNLWVSDATSDNPLAAIRVNSSNNAGRNFTLRYVINASAQWTRRFASKRGRSLSVRMAVAFNSTDVDSFNDYNTRYYRIKKNPDSTLVRRQYIDNDSRNLSLTPQVSWNEPVSKHSSLQLLYRYEYKHSCIDKSFYRFDTALPDFRVDPSRRMTVRKMTGELPSDYKDYYYDGFSSSGDYYYHAHLIQLNYRYSIKKFNTTIGVTLKPQNTRLEYPGADGLETVRNFVFNAAPNITLRYNPKKSRQLSLTYRSWSSNPSMNNLIPIPNGTNPLYVSIGNPHLKPPFTHTANLTYNTSDIKKHQSFNLNFNFRTVQNQVVTSTQYDSESGVRTSTPCNIDGNWSVDGNFSCNKTFRGSRFSISNQTSAEYRNELNYLYNSRLKADEVNKVTRLMFREFLDGSYRNDWLELVLSLSADYTRERSRLRPVLDRDPWSVSTGLTAVFTFPWKMHFDTDFTLLMQRGHSYKELNRNYYILNAELSQPLFKGRGTLRIGAYDLLDSQENILSTFSASSRAVNIYNGVSRYVMLSFLYRF